MIINDELSVKNHIKAGNPSRVYLVFGDESYLSVFYANQIASSVTDTSGMSFNYYCFDSETVSFDAVYEACETLPVMSDRVCVFVKDYNFSKATADELESYTGYFRNIPETSTLIFLMSSVEVDTKTNAKWKNVIDTVNKYGTVINLSKRTDSQVADLLVRSAGKRNTSISRENAEYFISVVGSQMNVLLNEFDKVCAYSQGNEVTKEMIDSIAVRSIEASVFDLTDAINSNRNDRAFEILSELIKTKTEATIIIGTIAFGYVDIYRAKAAEMSRSGYSEYLRSFANYKNKSFRLEKAAKNARKLSMKQIKELLKAVSEADIRIKSFSVDNTVILEELVAKLLYIAGGKQ
ncbi:MAG: DNA polymerase III subunit delta [Clostridia bacterium]|nr:DNA polymerase III subunit delta [Clostridia bacterium]